MTGLAQVHVLVGTELLLDKAAHDGAEVGPMRHLRQYGREHVPRRDPGSIGGTDRGLAVQQGADLVLVPDAVVLQSVLGTVVVQQGGDAILTTGPGHGRQDHVGGEEVIVRTSASSARARQLGKFAPQLRQGPVSVLAAAQRALSELRLDYAIALPGRRAVGEGDAAIEAGLAAAVGPIPEDGDARPDDREGEGLDELFEGAGGEAAEVVVHRAWS